MEIKKIQNKEISGPFTIPSGIVATGAPVLEKIANEIPEIGILTTKSIGLKPKEGNKEPIIAQFSPFSFINAVGLTNPGAEEFAKNLSKIKIPKNKFLLVSIFGGNEKEFKDVAEKLYDFTDGFELNVSCPHSDKYGQAIGQDKHLVIKIIKEVSSLGKPVFIKISPNLEVGEIIEYAIKAGISGITAINTKGPEIYLHDNHQILSNKVGGISGKAILNIGVESVRKIRKITNLPIIACGGISTAKDIVLYKEAGADFFGIGSALAGLGTEEIKKYFRELLKDTQNGTENAERFLKGKLNMEYEKFEIIENRQLAKDLFVLVFDKNIKIKPGQFIFVWLPGKGEKPFSAFDDEPLTLLVQKRGCLTDELSKLKKGDIVYIRGPYGNYPKIDGKILLVGGGTGIAALYLYAKINKKTSVILGAKDKQHLFYEKFKPLCENIYLSTENGEIGYKGLVTDRIEKIMENKKIDYCVNCGPEAMIKTAVNKERKYLSPDKIYSSIELLTKCGIGLCGSCSTPKGYRSCVDGTFFKFGKY
jgi:dihydroorotate dehydrogenase subfamily 1